MCKLATDEISIFELPIVFGAEETVLKLALSETPKTGFLPTRPISPASSLLAKDGYPEQKGLSFDIHHSIQYSLGGSKYILRGLRLEFLGYKCISVPEDCFLSCQKQCSHRIGSNQKS